MDGGPRWDVRWRASNGHRPARPRANRVQHADREDGRGRLFEAVNTRTGETIVFGSYGSALEHANQPIVTCDFPVPPDVSPDGTSDWLFQVTGFFRS